ncbi:hypothetical protein AAFN46_19240 [Pseudomonas sp. CAU 1711]|uniref:hypothetical protein n=1 Tax=Pseudomonas sp. CAU 1711 TaxID=3140356 RepID=UPI00326193EB
MLRRVVGFRSFHPRSGRRWISTSREFMVTQEPGSEACTRGAIATIVNTLRNQRLESIESVDEKLLAICEAYRRKGIDGLQPALEERAAREIFQHWGLFVIPARYQAAQLIDPRVARSLISTFNSGMYLSTSQPPNNPPTMSHSLVATNVVIDSQTNAIRYEIYDPYPLRQRNLNGMYELDANGLLLQRFRTGLFVSRY